MRTLLSQFCEEFDATVRALIEPATRTAAALDATSDALSCKALRPPLIELALQFESLADKVAEQQAYVLIFGPLKSGKSTLMNAISATYVSEVSSLPAYPCMVFVSHSEEREYTVTRYDGRTTTYNDPDELHMAIHRAHGELAEALRKDGGFDPAIDFPEAIRRIDFKLPAGELAESSTVLVDTPGLYSRMKFGYDRMTRDFKSSAACAIFVVKPDNLFLEQVFEEFNDLLELFSRIFLVVNIDGQKTDLAPDGSLKPSLEAAEPMRIIEAFEDLAMSAPLKRAADEGRLKIYPIDLLHAASERIRGEDGPASATRFETFRSDLTDYLDSTEYLVAFLGDSLRRSSALLDELDELAERREVAELRRADAAIGEDLAKAKARKEALQALRGIDWRARFEELRDRLAERFVDARGRIEDRTQGVLDGAVDAWFGNDDSLHTFNDKVIAGALRGHQEELLIYMEKELREEVSRGNAGLTVQPDLARKLSVAELDLGGAGATALGELHLLEALLDPASAIEPGQIPVKKRFWDWVLFRSAARVQKSLFGDPARPTSRISKADKERRLGRAGREAMLRAMDASTHDFFDEAAEHLEGDLLTRYAHRAAELTDEAIAARLEGVERRFGDLERQKAEHRAILDNLDDLGARAERARAAVDRLREQYGETDPAQLKMPLIDEGQDEVAVNLEAEADFVMIPADPPKPEELQASEPPATPAEVDESEIRLDL